jgi:Acetyltransferase (GNAT) domain
MNAKIIDVYDQLWVSTLEKVIHDTYNLPQYFHLEAQRNNAIPEAFLIGEEDKIFFAPYLLRKCDSAICNKFEALDVFDVISPYGYPGILVNEAGISSPKFLDMAISSFSNVLKDKGICSAFFRLNPILNNNLVKVCIQNNIYSDIFVPNGQTVSIDLKLSESELWAHTRKGHQSTINKCKRLGFTARMVSFEEYYDEFLSIYEETMNRVQASQSYYFDKNYFKALLDLDEKLHLCIVEFEERIICASLVFECCGIIQAHLGGTRDEFLRQSPFNLLLHHVRLWGRERGNEYLHIGGGIGGSTTDSLYTFKSGFSRQRHDFFTLRLITDKDNYLHLTKLKADALNVPTEELLTNSFFPVYRINNAPKHN